MENQSIVSLARFYNREALHMLRSEAEKRDDEILFSVRPDDSVADEESYKKIFSERNVGLIWRLRAMAVFLLICMPAVYLFIQNMEEGGNIWLQGLAVFISGIGLLILKIFFDKAYQSEDAYFGKLAWYGDQLKEYATTCVGFGKAAVYHLHGDDVVHIMPYTDIKTLELVKDARDLFKMSLSAVPGSDTVPVVVNGFSKATAELIDKTIIAISMSRSKIIDRDDVSGLMA